MRIIARGRLRDFWERYPEAEQPLKAWFAEAEEADWTSPADVKAACRSASVLRDCRIVFNIGGNKYHLVARIRYDYQLVNVRAVMTHREYDEDSWKE